MFSVQSDEVKGLFFGFLGMAAFGLTLPVTRLVVGELHPVFIGLGRSVAAALVAVLFLYLGKARIPNQSQVKKLILVALGVVVGFPVFSAVAMGKVPASHGGVVLGLMPLTTALFATFVTNERPSIGFWIFSVLGALLVCSYSLLQGLGTISPGDLALVAAMLCAALGYAVGGKLSRELGGWQVICWALLIALPVIAYPAWYFKPENLNQLSSSTWLGFLYLALVSQLFGFFLWNHGLALGGVARVSQVQLLQPFVTLLASLWLLKESISWLTILFAILVVLTVALGRKMPVHSATPMPNNQRRKV